MVNYDDFCCKAYPMFDEKAIKITFYLTEATNYAASFIYESIVMNMCSIFP